MNPRPWWHSLLRVAGMTAALWAALAALGVFLRMAPGWHPGAVAFTLALAAEGVIRLYQYESRHLGAGRGFRLVALRLAALALLAWILTEPTFVRTVKRPTNRQVAVLWDESASMGLTDDGTRMSRLEIARQALAGSGILKKLGGHARIRESRFARSPGNDNSAPGGGWDKATDIAAALDSVLEQIPPDELAGAILLTDGRHNRPSRVEDSARRFGVLDAPLGIVAVGNPEPPRDAAVLSVRSPDAMHLGERMRVSADLKFDGLKGREAVVRLTREGVLIDEKRIPIPQDRHREEVRFAHVPEEGGTGGYEIRIAALEGERFADNNNWSFETSITGARTNVLLVDSYPRWEFRYLRNLFYGRDKSVHLQWLLTHPDVAGGQAAVQVAASAARPFGESAATRLPENEAEWRKFDVIILGDLEPGAISAETWAVISRCVNERGALLVFVAGPNHMPHALEAEAARDLLPLDPGWSRRTLFGEGTEPFRLTLTSEGRRHPATNHTGGAPSNGEVWAEFPELQWRHPVASVKDGADILLTASNEQSPGWSAPDAGSALEGFAKRRESESKHALLVTRQTGNGKVAALMTDRTWRLREGAGDVHHHRFWGNLVRWGAGPMLRAGSDKVALGTDQLTYTADDPVRITVRLRNGDLSPVFDPSLKAEILRGGHVVATVPLTTVEGSAGLHEGLAAPIRYPGMHTIRVSGQMADKLAATDAQHKPTAGIRIVGARGPVELADTTPDRALLEEAAKASGGKVVEAADIGSLLPIFLTEVADRWEIRETPLWDNAVVFAALALVLTAEWWLRRNSGLP